MEGFQASYNGKLCPGFISVDFFICTFLFFEAFSARSLGVDCAAAAGTRSKVAGWVAMRLLGQCTELSSSR